MKFHCSEDAQLFLVEVDQISKISTVTDEFQADSSMVELYHQKRKKHVGKLKDFRKSQNAKSNWRKNRYKNMKGIKRFHKSTTGKRFHRSLGRFLATREFGGNKYKREAFDSSVLEVLTAISSLRTHHFIEFDYYHSMDEEIDYLIFSDELLPALVRIENALLYGDDIINEEDLDFLCRLVDKKALTQELCDAYPYVEKSLIIEQIDTKLEDTDSLAAIGSFLIWFNSIKAILEGMDEAYNFTNK